MKNEGSKPGKSRIQCDAHGRSKLSVICQHLVQERGRRYYSLWLGPDHPGDEQAWCEDCHTVLEEEGSWTNRVTEFAAISLVCGSCFQAVLRRHTRLRLVP